MHNVIVRRSSNQVTPCHRVSLPPSCKLRRRVSDPTHRETTERPTEVNDIVGRDPPRESQRKTLAQEENARDKP